MIQKYLIDRKIAKIYQREIGVFGGSGESVSFFSQFHRYCFPIKSIAMPNFSAVTHFDLVSKKWYT